MNLYDLQRRQPWTVPYRHGFTDMGNHAVLHAAKTVGKLSAVFEKFDHDGKPVDVSEIKAGAADLITAGMRLANLYGFNVETALCDRVREKNGIGFDQVGVDP